MLNARWCLNSELQQYDHENVGVSHPGSAGSAETPQVPPHLLTSLRSLFGAVGFQSTRCSESPVQFSETLPGRGVEFLVLARKRNLPFFCVAV